MRLFPWVLIHLAAVPVALSVIRSHNHGRQTLIAGLYLGWLLQALALQHLFDYVHVPAILLGLTVVFSQAVLTQRAVWRFGFAVFTHRLIEMPQINERYGSV